MRDMTIKLNVAGSYKWPYSFFLSFFLSLSKLTCRQYQKKKKNNDLHWNYHISTLPI